MTAVGRLIVKSNGQTLTVALTGPGTVYTDPNATVVAAPRASQADQVLYVTTAGDYTLSAKDPQGHELYGLTVTLTVGQTQVALPAPSTSMLAGLTVSPSPSTVATALAGYVRSGYSFCDGGKGGTATTQIAQNTARLSPWSVPNNCIIDQFFFDVFTAGESGAKVRVLLYSDDGTRYPANLVYDSGQIAADTTGIKTTASGLGLALTPGLYWVGTVSQACPTTAPLIRTSAGGGMAVAIATGTLPGQNLLLNGYSMTIAGAAPSTWSSTLASYGSSQAPRVGVKAL